MNYATPALAFLFLLASAAVSGYLYVDIHQSAATISLSRDQIAAITARDTFAKAAAQFLAETSAERSAVQFFVTPSDGTAGAIELIEQAGKLAGVVADVGSATLLPLAESHHEELSISVSTEATFAGAARFGTVLESLPRGAYLKQSTLEATDKGWYATYVVSLVKQK